jgi:hypothetical protein
MLLTAFLWLACPLILSAASFTVTLDRDNISVGDTATLSLNFDGGSPDALPSLPNIAQLRYQSVGDSTAISMVNGDVSSVVSHSYLITALRPGRFVIPSMTVSIDGQTYRSQPVTLTVLKSAPAVDPRTTFLKLIVPRTTVYVGEILPVQIQLYFQNVQGAEMPHLNEEGFTLGKMIQAGQSAPVLNGIQYRMFELRTFVVPAKVGKLNLGPATMSMSVPRPDARRDFFGRIADWQPVTLESNPQPLDVLPLPAENVPNSFSGAVGNFTLHVSVSPTNIAVGDPITVKVQISGQGPLENLTLPAQADWQQFKVYPPTSDFQPSDDSGSSGTRTFSLTVVPQNLEIKELPPFEFSYFDPNQKSYRTLEQPAVPLIVRPTAASLPPPTLATAGAADNSNAPRDIISIRQRLGDLTSIREPLIQQPWFLGLQCLPALVWAGLLIRRRQKEKMDSNPKLRRQKQVEQTIRSGLRELRQFASANQSVEFFAELVHLLQEQLGERLDLPASAITEAVLEERLQPLGLPEDQIAQLRELFQACNQARYARESTNAELVSLIPKTETALNNLKNIRA